MFLDEDSAVKNLKGPVAPKDLTAVLIDSNYISLKHCLLTAHTLHPTA